MIVRSGGFVNMLIGRTYVAGFLALGSVVHHFILLVLFSSAGRKKDQQRNECINRVSLLLGLVHRAHARRRDIEAAQQV